MSKDAIIDEDGFITVPKKKYSNKTKIQQTILKQSSIIENSEAKEIFEKYNPLSVILYGSYAKNNFNSNSDINIVILWNSKQKNIINSSTIDIKQKLEKIFNKKIEILPMLIKKNYYNDNYFITSIYSDAIVIYGNNAIDNIFNSEIYKHEFLNK